jgi:PAS domain S-box-containing protein
VLVVHDEPEVAHLVRHALEHTGLDVTEVGDGAGALAVAAVHDLAVIGLALHDMPGLDLIARLHADVPDMSIIALTGAPSAGDAMAGLLAGADDCMTDPVSTRELTARVAGMVRRRLRGRRASTRLQEIVTGVTSEVTDAVIVITPDHRIHSFNPAAEELYGWSASEAVGRPASDVLRWVGSPTTLDAARAKLATDGSWHGIAEQYRRDGSVMMVRASTQVLHTESGVPLGMISVNRLLEDVPTNAGRRAIELVEREIREGLAAGEFIVHYQPIFQLEDRQVVGVEALVRWQHGDELRMPMEFIGVAEESDLVIEIGKVVLATACQQVGEWWVAGHQLHLTVNISARQLLDPCLVSHLAEVLATTAMPPDRLSLEVTETALIEDIHAANRTLLRVAELGIGVSIDDFGTGWASLTYLQQLPITSVKIDRSFVDRIGDGRRDTAIVRSVLALARELDLTVIAEGIETESQLHQLRLLGCEFGQGFLVARPMPADELTF